MTGYWEELERPGPDAIAVEGGELRAGSRVRLTPAPGADALDLFLACRTAVIESVECDIDGTVTVAVVLDDDPGRDLGFARQPGHRFFFSVGEVQLLAGTPESAPAAPAAPPCRVLVAGIGNVFLGDDGFGVAVADRLWRRAPIPGVDVIDFGIRGMDLAFAMQDGYDAVVLLDALPRGAPPGTLTVLEVGPGDAASDLAVDAHGMDPVSVIGLVRSLGADPPATYVVGCEPQTVVDPEDPDVVAALSAPVQAAIDPAVELVRSLLADITAPTTQQEVPGPCRTSASPPPSSS